MTTAQLKFDCVQAHLKGEHPSWSDSEIFAQASVQCNERGGFAKTPMPALQGSVTAFDRSKAPAGQDPRIAQELAKHQALRESKDSVGDHVKRLQRIRQKMEADPALTFDGAFSQICKEESMQPAAASNAPKAVAVAAVKRKPDMLIESAFFNPIFPEDEDEE
jgi:hypothetical protein